MSSHPPRKVDQSRFDENMRQWYSAMEVTHAMILAGLRRKIGSEGDMQAAYRDWYRHQRELAEQRIDRAARTWQASQPAEPT